MINNITSIFWGNYEEYRYATGSQQKRGLIGWTTGGMMENEENVNDFEDDIKVYEVQPFVKAIENIQCLMYVPFLPTYKRHK